MSLEEQTLDRQNLYKQEESFDFVDDYQPEGHTSLPNESYRQEGGDYNLESIGVADGEDAYYDDNQVSNGNYQDEQHPEFRKQRRSSLTSNTIIRKKSLLEVSSVMNSLANLYVQSEFGKMDDQGGLFTLIPLETQLQVTYTWNISKDELLEGEKLVSLPFGPREWSWQIMYTFLT
jgi:hypothetical protein